MRSAPDWEVEGRDWPGRMTSQFVEAAGIRWHAQIVGEGPVMLLVHGTGAATHSWRAVAPLLSKKFKVVSLDLPGHGFTEMPSGGQFGLPEMSEAIGELLDELDVKPQIAVGHSAGAAIIIRMALAGLIAPRRLISLNGALLPFPGVGSVAFPALAKILFLNPIAAPFFAWRASNAGAVARLIEGTGSRLDDEGIDLYARLFRTERHVSGAVGMMANWDLRALKRELPTMSIPLELVTAERDRAIPPQTACDAKALIPTASIISIGRYGHLAHEEAPEVISKLILKLAKKPC
jgi:magnesium chelatase accessory protein